MRIARVEARISRDEPLISRDQRRISQDGRRFPRKPRTMSGKNPPLSRFGVRPPRPARRIFEDDPLISRDAHGIPPREALPALKRARHLDGPVSYVWEEARLFPVTEWKIQRTDRLAEQLTPNRDTFTTQQEHRLTPTTVGRGGPRGSRFASIFPISKAWRGGRGMATRRVASAVGRRGHARRGAKACALVTRSPGNVSGT